MSKETAVTEAKTTAVALASQFEEDAGEGSGGELEFGGEARNVIGGHDRAHHRGKVQRLGVLVV